MTVRYGILLLGSFTVIVASAQQTAIDSEQDATNANCIAKFPIPGYPALARRARLVGTLTVVVSLDQDARIHRISAQSHLNNDRAQAALLTPIENAIRKSDFVPSCGGKDVTLTFEFRINGDPYDQQQVEVTFGYPSHFTISARPPIPTNSQ